MAISWVFLLLLRRSGAGWAQTGSKNWTYWTGWTKTIAHYFE